MIKERFGSPILLALSSAQCVTHFGAYYHAPSARGEWVFGLFFALLSVGLLGFILWREFALPKKPEINVWLTASQYRLLFTLSALLALIIALQIGGGMTQVYLTTLPAWLRIATYFSLFLAIWQSEYVWGALFRARRIVQERGFAPEEAKNEFA